VNDEMDIFVERLRLHANTCRATNQYKLAALLNRAANEIERLRRIEADR